MMQQQLVPVALLSIRQTAPVLVQWVQMNVDLCCQTKATIYDWLKFMNREKKTNGRRDSLNNPNNSILLSSLEHISLSENIPIECTDPNCQGNYMCNEQFLQQRQQDANINERNECNEYAEQSRTVNKNQGNNEANNSEDDTECEHDNRKESIDSTELLISNKMTASTAAAAAATASATQNNPNLMENCTGDCEQCDTAHYNDECTEECNTDDCNNSQNNHGHNSNNFFDPLINHSGYCSGESQYNEENETNQLQNECQGGRYDSDSDDGWSNNQQASDNQSHYDNQQQEQQQLHAQNYEYNNRQREERSVTPEVISNKSSKEIYKDLAKQWGITCKMSDTCRCMECQGHYFDCEFDDNEHQKTDGGLGAGTPMFISEVMHGSACNIL
ncbi:uncharacterized protein DDB_G0283357 isoform X2 [Eurosta solidaginis]|uniref:uncharacterized protein DDB_G0283357 isoform X2 n=1 Tax=Eurosta solidaginis TaxID=178769 RepID=UPI00353066A7